MQRRDSLLKILGGLSDFPFQRDKWRENNVLHFSNNRMREISENVTRPFLGATEIYSHKKLQKLKG